MADLIDLDAARFTRSPGFVAYATITLHIEEALDFAESTDPIDKREALIRAIDLIEITLFGQSEHRPAPARLILSDHVDTQSTLAVHRARDAFRDGKSKKVVLKALLAALKLIDGCAVAG